MTPESKQDGYPWDVWQAAMEAVADISNEVDHPTDIIAQAILKVLASRLPRQDDEIRKAALEEAAKVAEQRSEHHEDDEEWWEGYDNGRKDAAYYIRALSQKGDEADG